MHNINLELESAHNYGQWAWDFLQTTVDHVDANPTTQLLLEAAYKLASVEEIPYDHPDAHRARVSMVLTIDAALTDPDAVMRALRYVREQLVKQDPALGIIGGK